MDGAELRFSTRSVPIWNEVGTAIPEVAVEVFSP
jgi:hypothetical protein